MTISKQYNSCAESLAKDMEKKTRQENRKIAFENYKRKHYLNDCHFFCMASMYTSPTLIITRDAVLAENMRERPYYNEITAPHTLVKYVKMAYDGKCDISIHDSNIHYRCKSLEELKENILIERLSGLL